jgi:hypothetical protein
MKHGAGTGLLQVLLLLLLLWGAAVEVRGSHMSCAGVYKALWETLENENVTGSEAWMDPKLSTLELNA